MQSPAATILKGKYIAINAAALFKQNKTGIEWYTWQLIKYLSREWKKLDMPIVLLVPKNLVKSSPSIFLKNKNWYLKSLDGNNLWTQYFLLKFLKRYPPAILFSPSYVAPLFLPTKIPTINVVHGLEGEHFPEFRPVKQILSEYLLTIPTLKKSSLIIAVSEHTKRDLNYFYGIPLDKIKTVLSGPGTSDDHEITCLESTKIVFKKEDKIINFFFSGGSNERKNLELGVRIFTSLISNQKVNARLYITGKIHGANANLKKLMGKYSKNIIELGYISEKKKKEYLKISHFLLYPSFYEGFGFPILEAQNFGTVPIILKDSGLAEIGGKGMITINNSSRISDLTVKLKKIIGNPAKFKKLQELGVENVRKYSWQKCAKETKKALLQIITH